MPHLTFLDVTTLTLDEFTEYRG